MFKAELTEYAKDEVDVGMHIEYKDNQPTLELLEKAPGGLIAMLDEECFLPGAISHGLCSYGSLQC